MSEPLLPEPGPDGVYRYPDGSRIEPTELKFGCDSLVYCIEKDGKPQGYFTQAAFAARILLAIGQGPASLRRDVEPDADKARIAELLEENRRLRLDLAEFQAAHRGRMTR